MLRKLLVIGILLCGASIYACGGNVGVTSLGYGGGYGGLSVNSLGFYPFTVASTPVLLQDAPVFIQSNPFVNVNVNRRFFGRNNVNVQTNGIGVQSLGVVPSVNVNVNNRGFFPRRNNVNVQVH